MRQSTERVFLSLCTFLPFSPLSHSLFLFLAPFFSSFSDSALRVEVVFFSLSSLLSPLIYLPARRSSVVPCNSPLSPFIKLQAKLKWKPQATTTSKGNPMMAGMETVTLRTDVN